MPDKLNTGFIGLGNQGMPIARQWVDAGYPLGIWARRPESLEPFGDTAATVAETPEELARTCDLLGICVVNDDDVRQVLVDDGVLDAMRPGSIVALHSTLLPSTVISLAAMARERGVHVLDAPVSGGHHGARAGTMTVMVGGDIEPLERVRSVFETFATKIAHLGAVGSGQMMKLLNNNLAYANIVMGINALELAGRLGMDREAVSDIIRSSSGFSGGFGILLNPELLAKIVGPTSNLAKDVHHLVEVAQEAGCGDADLLRISSSATARLNQFVATK